MRTVDVLLMSFALAMPACDAPQVQRGDEAEGAIGLVLFEDTTSGRIGFRTQAGRIVIPPRYVLADTFSRYGLAPVADSSGWAYIDTTGAVVIRPVVYDSAPDAFEEGLARYAEDGRFGFFDERGQVQIAAQFDFVQPFSEGRAAFCEHCTLHLEGEHERYAGGQWGFIDRTGAIVIPPQFDLAWSFEEGRAMVMDEGRRFMVDRAGNEVED